MGVMYPYRVSVMRSVVGTSSVVDIVGCVWKALHSVRG